MYVYRLPRRSAVADRHGCGGGCTQHVSVHPTTLCLPLGSLGGIKFWKVLCIVTLYSKYTRALIFQKFCQAAQKLLDAGADLFALNECRYPPPLKDLHVSSSSYVRLVCFKRMQMDSTTHYINHYKHPPPHTNADGQHYTLHQSLQASSSSYECRWTALHTTSIIISIIVRRIVICFEWVQVSSSSWGLTQ
jgi:hypothetical protein